MRQDYKDIIENNFDNIEKWLQDGLTFKQIASNLGISDRTLLRYRQSEDTEGRLGQSIKNGRAVAVETLENSMFKSACGYERTVKKYAKVKRVLYDEITGKKTEEYEEMVEYEETQYFPPDTTAAIFLLKNWGNYMNEPRAMEYRKREVEVAEKKANAQVW